MLMGLVKNAPQCIRRPILLFGLINLSKVERNRAPTDPYAVLHEDEAHFVRAWASVAFPRTATTPIAGEDADLDHFFDGVLQRSPETTANLLTVLLNALNTASIVSHGDRFVALTQSDRNACFESWTHSNTGVFRSACQGLVLLLGMGWSTHPEVAPTFALMHSCGYGA